MMKNVLEYLERSEALHPDKAAVIDREQCFTYRQLLIRSQCIGSAVSKYGAAGKPVPILMEKSADTLAAMFGILYAGSFYIPVHPSQPAERLKKILDTLEAETVLTCAEHVSALNASGYTGRVLLLEELLQETIDIAQLSIIRERSKDTDLLYGIFTSGSTGNPKGVIVSHQAVIQFINHFIELFLITKEDIIGNQAPFDFDVSVKDIYSSIATGATLVLIPKELFSVPPRLLDYLCETRVTTLVWAVAALCLITALKGLEYRIPSDVKRVLFSGEVMPVKHLNIWRQALPGAGFVNLYGPSEITCNCTYYRIERHFGEDEKLPIGKAFPGRRVFLLDEEDKPVTSPGETGEICVAGESLSEGYYNNPDETRKRFIKFPIEATEERVYRTGDIGYFDMNGELYFGGRRDFQIKHMGHRIELEEIESNISSIDGVELCCCMFDTKKNQILTFYVGKLSKALIRREMKKKLPPYMLPNKIVKLEQMPLTKNGKTDRQRLMEITKGG